MKPKSRNTEVGFRGPGKGRVERESEKRGRKVRANSQFTRRVTRDPEITKLPIQKLKLNHLI